MSLDLVRRLASSGFLQREEVQRVLAAHVVDGVPILRALINFGFLSSRTLDSELGRIDGPTLRSVQPVARLLETLPPGMCQRLLALPVRQDTRTGTVDIAAVDPNDQHVRQEFAHHLASPVRVIRAPMAAIEEALLRLEPPAAQLSPPFRSERPTPPYVGVPAFGDQAPVSIPLFRHALPDSPIPLVRRATEHPPSLDNPPSTAEYQGSLGGNLASPALPVLQPNPIVNIEAVPETRRVSVPSMIPPTRPQAFANGAPRGPFASPEPFLTAIRQATTREDVLSPLLAGLGTVSRCVGILAVRKGEFQGWQCNEAMAAANDFRQLRVRMDVPSLFATAGTTGFFLGPIPRTPAHSQLLALLGNPTTEVSATPVRVSGKLAMIIVLHELGDTMLATKRAEEFARIVGEVLANILARK